MAASVGIPAASLCINRRLYQIASVKAVSISNAEKRRAALIDALICVLFPLVYVAMQYIVQGHRFNIYEQIGCYPALYNSIPMYFISTMWPPLLGLVSAVYGVLALRAFAARRAAFAQFLSPSQSSVVPGLTVSRYLRLMALATTAILLTTPLGIFAIWLNLTATPVGPWISWSDTHFLFSRVESIPAVLWRSNHLLVMALEFTRWAAPLTALVFFGFFGFAVEARKHYSLALGFVGRVFWSGMGRLGLRRPTSGLLSARPTSSSQSQGKFGPGAGVGYTKPPPGKPIDISLPAYSSGTGSFTAGSFDADLKRAASFVSSAPSMTTSSRFVESFHGLHEERAHQQQHEHDAVSVSSLYPADADADIELRTPASATSFASTSTPTTAEYAHSLPPHVGWAEHAYPASPTSPGHGYIVESEGEGEWTPTSDTHSIHLQPLPHEHETEAAARGRSLA